MDGMKPVFVAQTFGVPNEAILQTLRGAGLDVRVQEAKGDRARAQECEEMPAGTVFFYDFNERVLVSRSTIIMATLLIRAGRQVVLVINPTQSGARFNNRILADNVILASNNAKQELRQIAGRSDNCSVFGSADEACTHIIKA